MKRLSIICMGLLLSIATVAQTVNVHMKSGEIKVYNSAEVDYIDFTQSDNNVVEAIDLGLTSGTKWANMNVGATAPEEYGDFFAWGETTPKDLFEYFTPFYEFYDPNVEGGFVDIGNNIQSTQYDAATVNWGENWCMPTADQYQELIDQCSTEVVTINDVTGMLFIGPNGNSIFLPPHGVANHGSIYGDVDTGYYWASTRLEGDPSSDYYYDLLQYAHRLFFNINIGDNGYASVNDYQQQRPCGLLVRPVAK